MALRTRARVVLAAPLALVLAICAPAAASSFGQITLYSPHGLSNPTSIVAGPDGNLWFVDQGTTPAIGRITPSGQITEFPVGQITKFVGGEGDRPDQITPGPDGNLWFTDPSNGAIGRITPGGQVTDFTPAPPLAPMARVVTIATGPGGALWVAGGAYLGAPFVGEVTTDGQFTPFTGDLQARASVPTSIAMGPDGAMWFADQGKTPAIGRVTPAGDITEFTQGLQPRATLAGVTAGPDGNVWFTDPSHFGLGTPSLGTITPSGTISEFSKGLMPRGVTASIPEGLATGPDHGVWFVDDDQIGTMIGRVGPGHQIIESPAGTQSYSSFAPGTITAGPDGAMWFTDGGEIGRIEATGSPSVAQRAPRVPLLTCDAPTTDVTGVKQRAWRCVLSVDPEPAPARTSGLSTATLTDHGSVMATGTATTVTPGKVVVALSSWVKPLNFTDVIRSLIITTGRVHHRLHVDVFR
jgi:streptogramin lyase